MKDDKKSMRTAFLTAYPKIFTDINYSVSIFSNMKNLAVESGFAFLPEQFSNEMTVEIEGRYKALNKALENEISDKTLIIELAAGMSPRHLEYKDYNYYEFDFEEIINIKKELYKKMNFESLNEKLYGFDLNDLNMLHSHLQKIISSKDNDKVIILSEGLFWYLTKEQIEKITGEISNTLMDYNWVWITSDCPTEDKLDLEYRNIISNSANVKREKTFNSFDDFSTFFSNLGLNTLRFKLLDFIRYENISSARLLSSNKEDTEKKLNTYTDIAIIKRV